MRFKQSFVVISCFGSIACATGDQSVNPDNGGMPALTAEDQALLSEMARTKLAEIELPDGKLEMFEPLPGEFVTLHSFPIGAEELAIPADLSPLELFRKLAPDRAVPQAILDAQTRFHHSPAAAELEGLPVVAGVEPHGAISVPASATHQAGDRDTTVVQSALASTINWTWFQQQYCMPYAGPIQWNWCWPQAWTTAYTTAYTHSSSSVMCGDTGAATWRIRWGGADRHLVPIAYGKCQRYNFHGPHDTFGGSLLRTLVLSVDWAEDTVRFAGYFVGGGHPFVATPPGF